MTTEKYKHLQHLILDSILTLPVKFDKMKLLIVIIVVREDEGS